MKKYLFGILFIIVVLSETSFAAQVNFSMGSTSTEIPNLIGHWALDGNALDSSGNGNNGSVVGATPTTDRFGVENRAYSFDGNLNRIEIPYSNVLDVSGSQITLSAWINVDRFVNSEFSSGGILSNDGYSAGYRILISNDTSKVTTQMTSASSLDSPTGAFELNKWVHVATTYDGSMIRTYVNGQAVSALPKTGNLAASPEPLWLGQGRPSAASWNYPFEGSIDDVRIYDRGLTALEIQQLYTMTEGSPTSPICGDGTCDAGENNSNCPGDCPVGPPVCGDGTCDAGEDNSNCPGDCPVGPPVADCSVAGTCYYINNSVNNSGNGSSWNNAWKSFADITWSQIDPGNVIYISGGTNGKTYNEKMIVKASGTSGNQITITKGIDAGHNGEVLFDGAGVGGEAIYISRSNCNGYVTISNFYFTNWKTGVHVSGSSGSTYSESGASIGVIVENNDFWVNGSYGVFVQTSKNIIVRNNHIETPTWVDAQTDGLYSQKNHQNVYEYNTIIINNQEPSGHDDCIQLLTDTDITMRGNYLEQNNSKVNNAQGLIAEDVSGTTKFYDNVVNLKGATSNALPFREGADGSGLEIIGNTVFGKNPYHLIWLRDFDNPIIKNNLGVITGKNVPPLELLLNKQSSITYTPSYIRNNLLWNPQTADIANVYGLGKLTQTELEGRGMNLGGLNVNPQFRNPENGDFTPMNPAVCSASDTGSYLGAVPCEQ